MQEGGAEQLRGDRAQREEDGDARRRRVPQRPEPEQIADPARHADEQHGEPDRPRARRGREQAFERGGWREAEHGSRHGERADRQGRVAQQIGAVEHRARGSAQRGAEHREHADPGIRAPRARAERDTETDDGEQHARRFRGCDPFAAERGGDQHGEQRKGREEQRAVGRAHEAQPDIEQRDQQAELHGAEQHDHREVGAGDAEMPVRPGEGQQAEQRDRVAQQRERGGAEIPHGEARRHHRRADLHARGRRGGERAALTRHKASSQFCPTRSLPKEWWRSSATSVKPAST